MQALESGDKASRVQLLLGLAEGSLLYPSVFFFDSRHSWVYFVYAEPYFDVTALELG